MDAKSLLLLAKQSHFFTLFIGIWSTDIQCINLTYFFYSKKLMIIALSTLRTVVRVLLLFF